MTVGTFDPALFARMRAARGTTKRLLLDRLYRENEPLLKTIVDQLCGPRFRPMAGCEGFREIPWEDAMQGAALAFLKAAEQFDPAKGKFSPYLLSKIRYELQRIVEVESSLTRVKRGTWETRTPVALLGEQAELDAVGGSEDAEPVDLRDIGVTPEDVERWKNSGEWPETAPENAEPVDRTTRFDRFVEETGILVFAASAMAIGEVAWNTYRLAWRRTSTWRRAARSARDGVTRPIGGEMSRMEFAAALARRGVRARRLRLGRFREPMVGLLGVKVTGCDEQENALKQAG